MDAPIYSARQIGIVGGMTGPSVSLVSIILDRIDLGRLNPGDVILEQELIEEFKVSRTPVREALLQLEATGLIRRLPRKGATVFRPTLQEFLSILEVHANLEGQAASLAARRLSAAHGRALETAVTACEAHRNRHGDGQPDRYYQLNIAFHGTVAQSAGNPFLFDLIKVNARKLMAYYRARYHYAGAIAASVQEHQTISRLILDRNATEARDQMIAHVQFDQVTAMDLIVALG